MFDKRYQVNRTFFTIKKFPSRVEAAMPNRIEKDNTLKLRSRLTRLISYIKHVVVGPNYCFYMMVNAGYDDSYDSSQKMILSF